MKELATSIIWYVHTDVPRIYISSDSSLKFQIQPVVLTRSITDGTSLTSPLAPHVQPQYYAAIIAAEAIGSSGNTQVLELDINDPTISGYAFYNGQLETAVLINSEPYFTTTTTARTSRLVNLIFEGSSVGSVPSTMTVKRLSVPYVQLFFPKLQLPDDLSTFAEKQGTRMIHRV